MKKLNTKMIILGIALIILIAGCVVVGLKGFNYSLDYDNSDTIALDIGKNIQSTEIQGIVNEVTGNNENRVEAHGQSILVTARNISDEDKQDLVNKINEKYETELTTDGITAIKNLRVDLSSLITKHIYTEITIILVITAYFMILHRKNNVWTVACNSIVSMTLTQLLYFSIIGITRIPVCNLVMPISIIVLIATVCALEINFRRGK